MSLEDNPANPDRDITEVGVMRRYDRANLMAIATSNRIVFESLSDIPRMVKEIKALKEELEALKGKNGE